MLPLTSQNAFKSLHSSINNRPLIFHLDGVDQVEQSDSDVFEESCCSTRQRQARMLEAGLWISPWVAVTVAGTDEEWLFFNSVTSGILLLLLRCNKRSRMDQLPDDQKQLMATDLIPYLLSLITVFVFTFADDFFEALSSLSSLVVVVATGTRFSSRCLFRVSRWVRRDVLCTNFNPKSALLLGLWLWSVLFFFMADSYLYDLSFAMLNIGNGILLFLLWCTKQSDDELDHDHHGKQLLASEVIPVIFSTLLSLYPEFILVVLFFAIFFVITYLFCYGIPSWTEIKMKNLDPLNFKILEERYFEELRHLEEDEDRQLQAQIDRFAYLEDLAATARTKRKKHLAKRQLLVITAIIAALVLPIIAALVLHMINTPRPSSYRRSPRTIVD